ncbi:MAG TPA: hypothetical protein VIV64_11000 [Gammaproteobacteria bacterium]
MRALTLILGLLAAAPTALAQDDTDATADETDAAFEDAFSDFDDFDAGFEEDESELVFSGFAEGAFGRRLDGDPNFSTRQTLGDLRARVETEWAGDKLVLSLKADALYDDYLDEFDIEPRDLSLRFSPGGSVDLKIGRQVLTWGTGDLLFLNDVFPKSWVSFFSGRDDEYLKAPSDAVRATWYSSKINIDVAWSPQFEPDDYLTGSRFSFFSPQAGTIVAPHPPLAAAEPSDGIEGGELALRFFRTVGSTELAGYAYRGFFKRPLGLTPQLAPTFPRLNVIGGSLRRPLGQGLINAEFAYHDSRGDTSGTNPLTPNSQLRLLAGYEFEARTRLNLGFQLYIEQTQDYAALIANSLAPEFEPDRTRYVVTNRLTWRDARDKLTLSLFTYYSGNDDDYYLRPVVSYRQSDQWTITAGANLFGGAKQHTFFGQLEDNSNAYLRVRFNY